MKKYIGKCHCGGVKFEFNCDDKVEIWKCNCSICNLIDYEHLFIKHDQFLLLQGQELLNEYKFGTMNARHFTCKVCGIKSFYQPRSHPDSYSINLKCVENPPKINNIVHFDGINSF